MFYDAKMIVCNFCFENNTYVHLARIGHFRLVLLDHLKIHGINIKKSVN